MLFLVGECKLIRAGIRQRIYDFSHGDKSSFSGRISQCDHRLVISSLNIANLKRTIKLRASRCHNLGTQSKTLELKVGHLKARIRGHATLNHVSGVVSGLDLSIYPVPPVHVDDLSSILHSVMGSEDQKSVYFLPSLEEFSEIGSPRIRNPRLHRLAFCIKSNIIKCMRRCFLETMKGCQASVERKGGNVCLDFVEFCSKLRFSSTKEAWLGIFYTVKPLRTQEFIRSLKEKGYGGDSVLLASKIDMDRKGCIDYADFLRFFSR